MQAKWQGYAIAESDAVQTVAGYTYFPRQSVRMELLRQSPKTAGDLACPHGVQFYDLVHAGATSERAAWSYEAPQSAMRSIEHWVGFWRDVELT
jgi:uncharacterized protein (DUF427 family)